MFYTSWMWIFDKISILCIQYNFDLYIVQGPSYLHKFTSKINMVKNVLQYRYIKYPDIFDY